MKDKFEVENNEATLELKSPEGYIRIDKATGLLESDLSDIPFSVFNKMVKQLKREYRLDSLNIEYQIEEE